MTRRELYTYLRRSAEAIYDSREATQIVNMIFDEMLSVSRMDLLREPEAPSPLTTESAEQIARDLAAGRPVQYIIGEAEFCDFRVAVREGVLIPRPESEELIRWVADEADHSAHLNILDIGTGSGALAIALRRALTSSNLWAVDISEEALSIAQTNVDHLAPDITLSKADALQGVENYLDEKFDIIISNPPYIPRSEEGQMRINVTKYEPHLALFVADDDPLIFYRSIARSATRLLNDGGALYFEIHEIFGAECQAMLREEGFSRVELKLDINDKARMICARK